MNGTQVSQLPRASVFARTSVLLLSFAISSVSTAYAQTDGTSGTSTPSSDEAAPAEGTAAPAEATEEAPAEEAPAEGTALAAPAAASEEEAPSDAPRTEEEAEEVQAASEPLAWRNSFLSLTGGSTFNSFVRDGQLTYNPYVYAGVTLTPRWYITPAMFLVANLSAFYEFTDSDFDTYNHEIALTDTTLDLRYTAAVDRFVFIPSARLTFPTSKASQGAQRYFNTGLGLTAVIQIPEFLSSNVAVGFAYRRWWAGTNVVLTTPYPAASAPRAGVSSFADGEIGTFTDSTGGAASAADRLLLSIGVNVTPVSGLTLSLSTAWVWDRAFDNASAELGCGVVLTNPCGTSTPVEESATNYRWRVFAAYTFQAAYDFLPWLNIGLGVSNAASLALFWDNTGNVRSPFGPDTQVFLSATVTLDGLYEAVTAGGEDDGLTPEERQRRRQGLASLDADDTDEEEAHGEAPASRTPVAF